MQTEAGQFDLEVPRDRDSSCEPQLVEKCQRRFEGFDDKVPALYKRALSTRKIQVNINAKATPRCSRQQDLYNTTCRIGVRGAVLLVGNALGLDHTWYEVADSA